MPEMITFGEALAVFSPKSSGPFRYLRDFELHMAGAESNTAIGLQKLGHTTGWFSRLGEDEVGQFVLNAVRAEGVDVSRVAVDPNHRTGLMVKEIRDQGETRVYYYRDQSACSFAKPEDIEEEYLKTAKIFHFTGITPVLSDSCKQAVCRAMELADKNGVKLSFDPNIRYKLWGKHDYSAMLREMMLQSQIVLAGLDEAGLLLQAEKPQEVFEKLFSLGRVEIAALKDGGKGAWVAAGGEIHHIPPFPCHCIDPVGAGDSFNAAFLAGVLEGLDVKTCGEMGAVAGALATQSLGDIESQPTRQEMDRALHHSKTVFR